MQGKYFVMNAINFKNFIMLRYFFLGFLLTNQFHYWVIRLVIVLMLTNFMTFGLIGAVGGSFLI